MKRGRFEFFREERVEQTAAGVIAGGEACLQPVAQGHQRVDLGDDAALFCEWRESEGQSSKLR